MNKINSDIPNRIYEPSQTPVFTRFRFPKIPPSLMRNGLRTTKSLNLIKGIVSRVKQGPVVSVAFPAIPSKCDKVRMERFLNFNVTSKPPFETDPLHFCQIEKLQEFAACDHSGQCKKFLDKVLTPKCTRQDFTRSDWVLLREINLSLIKDHFENLEKLFNTPYFDQIQQDFMDNFLVDYKEAVIAETLAKSLAYTAVTDGEILPIPVKNEEGKYQLVEYKVEMTSVGDALPCFVLESAESNAHPWFVARGTDMQNGLAKGLESFLADVIDHRGLAEDAIIKSMFHKHSHEKGDHIIEKPSLIERFEKWEIEGKLPNVTGHSLGGYIISALTVYFYYCVKKAYSFNGTALSLELADRWEKLLLKDEDVRHKIVNFSCEGDFVTSAGRKLIDDQIAITLKPEPKLNDPVHMHLKLLLNRAMEAQAVDVEKENSKKSRAVSEAARALFGGLIHKAMDTYYKDLLPDWWIQRDHYRMRLAEYEANQKLFSK